MSNTVRRDILNKRNNFHNKHVVVGPGGKHCACCFPAPGTKFRRKLIKIARRRERIADFLIEEMNALMPNEDINYMVADDMWMDEYQYEDEYEDSFLMDYDMTDDEYNDPVYDNYPYYDLEYGFANAY